MDRSARTFGLVLAVAIAATVLAWGTWPATRRSMPVPLTSGPESAPSSEIEVAPDLLDELRAANSATTRTEANTEGSTVLRVTVIESDSTPPTEKDAERVELEEKIRHFLANQEAARNSLSGAAAAPRGK